MTLITIQLLREIKHHYQLDWYGTHGVYHWCRVYENGMILADQSGVNRKVVELFSVFHDSQRRNENYDENHGRRGAELAAQLRSHIVLNDGEFEQLTTACALHTTAETHPDITVQACFDSDRLDLARVGTIPQSKYLSTPVGKNQQTIREAMARSRKNELPLSPFGFSQEEIKRFF